MSEQCNDVSAILKSLSLLTKFNTLANCCYKRDSNFQMGHYCKNTTEQNKCYDGKIQRRANRCLSNGVGNKSVQAFKAGVKKENSPRRRYCRLHNNSSMYFCSIPSLSLPISITFLRSWAFILQNSCISRSVRMPMCTSAGRSSATPRACRRVRSAAGALTMLMGGCFLQGTCSTVTTDRGSCASE